MLTKDKEQQMIDLMNYLVGYQEQEVADAALVTSARFHLPVSRILKIWYNGENTSNQFGQEF